jgi:hypothetical protein
MIVHLEVQVKKCTHCKQPKDESDFYRNRSRHDGLRAVCKSCAADLQRDWCERNRGKANASTRRWARANPDKVKATNKGNQERTLKVRQRVVSRVYQEYPCLLCGESREPTLDFHHLDPKEKKRRVCSYRTARTALIEARKCVVLCSNCHRLLHAGTLELPKGAQPLVIPRELVEEFRLPPPSA